MSHDHTLAEHAATLAKKHTMVGLLRGKVFHHTTASGESLTVGKHCTAVASAHKWSVLGHNTGRVETFSKLSKAVTKFMELAHA